MEQKWSEKNNHLDPIIIPSELIFTKNSSDVIKIIYICIVHDINAHDLKTG